MSASGSTGGGGAKPSLAPLALTLLANACTRLLDETHAYRPALFRTSRSRISSVYSPAMADLRFDWDPKKHRDNQRDHKVSFEEAKTAFADERGLLMADPDHSEDEDRFLLLGLSARLRLLVVCHTYQEEDEVIRLISARTADRSERTQYSRRWKR